MIMKMIQKVIAVIVAIMIIAKIFKMIVLKGMIKIIFYSPKFFKTGSINEMLF